MVIFMYIKEIVILMIMNILVIKSIIINDIWVEVLISWIKIVILYMREVILVIVKINV